ncbi:hypothetical protein J4464_03235 [Candidatus Woesearchaeota archaeon]|nr:hypothetical protein [Candidatus Woesearchaeota archaeon]
MNYFRRNVNLFLLFMIILLIASFTGFTIYYKNTYENLLTTYFELRQEHDKTAEELSLRRAQLNATLEEFELKQEREQSLSTKYSDIRDVNAELANDLAGVRKDLSDTQGELATAKSDLASKEVTITDLNKQNSDLKTVNSALKSDLDNVCDAYTAATGQGHGDC